MGHAISRITNDCCFAYDYDAGKRKVLQSIRRVQVSNAERHGLNASRNKRSYLLYICLLSCRQLPDKATALLEAVPPFLVQHAINPAVEASLPQDILDRAWDSMCQQAHYAIHPPLGYTFGRGHNSFQGMSTIIKTRVAQLTNPSAEWPSPLLDQVHFESIEKAIVDRHRQYYDKTPISEVHKDVIAYLQLGVDTAYDSNVKFRPWLKNEVETSLDNWKSSKWIDTCTTTIRDVCQLPIPTNTIKSMCVLYQQLLLEAIRDHFASRDDLVANIDMVRDDFQTALSTVLRARMEEATDKISELHTTLSDLLPVIQEDLRGVSSSMLTPQRMQFELVSPQLQNKIRDKLRSFGCFWGYYSNLNIAIAAAIYYDIDLHLIGRQLEDEPFLYLGSRCFSPASLPLLRYTIDTLISW